MWEVLSRAAGSGWRTSEFWVSVLALVLPIGDAASQRAASSPDHAIAGIVGGAVVAAGYSIARAITKKAAIEAAAPQAAAEVAAGYVDGNGPVRPVTSGGVARP